jgi:LPS export ABC transporter permease LptG
MSAIDRYILGEWMKAFCLALGATLGLLVLEDLYDDLPDLLEDGANWAEVVRYYVFLTPSFLPAVIPISLMVSILFSLGNHHRNNEITAMRACGMSLWRISRTICLAGLVLAVGLFALNGKLVPQSIEAARIIRENLDYTFALEEEKRDADEVGVVRNLTFFNHKEGRMWFINRFSEYTYRGYGIAVSVFDDHGVEITRLMANEGYFDGENWVFLQGRETSFSVADGEPVRSLKFDEKAVAGFREKPRLMIALEKKPKDLSLFELREILDKLGGGADPRVNAYAVRYNGILANPFSVLIVVGLAVPFAATGVRVNPLIGVSKSIGLFFFYFLFATICTMMGEREVLSPLVAAWSPNAVMVICALYLYRRAV